MVVTSAGLREWSSGGVFIVKCGLFVHFHKAMYGMNSSGGYATQYSRQLERDVTRNKSSVGDYYARKAEMLKILMTDNDSGESCTRG